MLLNDLMEHIDKTISWNKLVLDEMKFTKYFCYFVIPINGIFSWLIFFGKNYYYLFLILLVYVISIGYSNIKINNILRVKYNIKSQNIFGGRKEFYQIKLSKFVDYLKSQQLDSIELLETLLREGNIELNRMESDYFKIFWPLLCIVVATCFTWIYGNIKTAEIFIVFTLLILIYIIGISIALSGFIASIRDYIEPKRVSYENMLDLLRDAVILSKRKKEMDNNEQ